MQFGVNLLPYWWAGIPVQVHPFTFISSISKNFGCALIFSTYLVVQNLLGWRESSSYDGKVRALLQSTDRNMLIYNKSKHRTIEYLELQWPQKDHSVQLLTPHSATQNSSPIELSCSCLHLTWMCRLLFSFGFYIWLCVRNLCIGTCVLTLEHTVPQGFCHTSYLHCE